MYRTDLNIELIIDGPLITQSSEPGHDGLDMIIARTSEGTPYIPGTLITGHLAQAWQEIDGAVDDKAVFDPNIEKWLGKDSENDAPKSKQLFFTDFLLQNTLTSAFIHHRVRIDKDRGAASENQLVMIESPFLQGKKYTFEGALSFFAADPETDTILQHVEAGLRWLSQLGAQRTTGYGRLANVRFPGINKRPITDPQAATNTAPKNIGLAITPEHAFCLSKHSIADNLFESEAIIPGSAILGAIATTWSHLAGESTGTVDSVTDDSARLELKKYFNQLRISHAFPSAIGDQRPVVAPLSLVRIDKEHYYDVANCELPCLIDGKVPDFAIDWKDRGDVDKDFGWPQLTKELRIRTAIEPDEMRSAESELFSYEQIVPRDQVWYAELDLSRIGDDTARSLVFEQIKSLLAHGMIGLGKTKTTATVEFLAASLTRTHDPAPKSVGDKQWIITLQTDTLLGSPEKLTEASGQAELREMYENTWKDISGGALELVRYFARQKLAGGAWRRHTRQQGDSYRPWVLTEAGSVFILRAADSESRAQAWIDKWFEQGLPLSDPAKDYYRITGTDEEHWKQCPYIPQNGYGEIAVNLEVHTAEHHQPLNPAPIKPLPNKEGTEDAA